MMTSKKIAIFGDNSEHICLLSVVSSQRDIREICDGLTALAFMHAGFYQFKSLSSL